MRGWRTVLVLPVAVALFRTNIIPVRASECWRCLWFLSLLPPCAQHSNIQFLRPLARSNLSPQPPAPQQDLCMFSTFYKSPKLLRALRCSAFLSVSVSAFSTDSRPSFSHFLRRQSRFLTDSPTREPGRAVWGAWHSTGRKLTHWKLKTNQGRYGHLYTVRLPEHLSQSLCRKMIFAYLTVGGTKDGLWSTFSRLNINVAFITWEEAHLWFLYVHILLSPPTAESKFNDQFYIQSTVCPSPMGATVRAGFVPHQTGIPGKTEEPVTLIVVVADQCSGQGKGWQRKRSH